MKTLTMIKSSEQCSLKIQQHMKYAEITNIDESIILEDIVVGVDITPTTFEFTVTNMIDDELGGEIIVNKSATGSNYAIADVIFNGSMVLSKCYAQSNGLFEYIEKAVWFVSDVRIRIEIIMPLILHSDNENFIEEEIIKIFIY